MFPPPPRFRSAADRRGGRGQAPDESPIFEETSAWFRDNWMVGPGGSPDAVPPAMHIQVAERIRWMEGAHQLPAFERFPPQS